MVERKHRRPEKGTDADPYRPTTPDARLTRLTEECAELILAISKARRFGMRNYDPRLPIEERRTNRQQILYEIKDVRTMLDAVQKDLLHQDEAVSSPQRPPGNDKDRFRSYEGRDHEEHGVCRAAEDGSCFWDECPQIRDYEPLRTGRRCPRDGLLTSEGLTDHGRKVVEVGLAALYGPEDD